MNSCLAADINKQAEDVFFRLVKQTAECEGITEKLKMKRLRRINNIRNLTKEIIDDKTITDDNGGQSFQTLPSLFSIMLYFIFTFPLTEWFSSFYCHRWNEKASKAMQKVINRRNQNNG